MTRGAAYWAESVARRIGVGGAVDFTPANVGQTLHIPCARGHRVDYFINKRMPPEIIAKKMMEAGWTIGSRLICPKHSRKPQKADATPPQHKEEEIMVTPAPAAPPPPSPTVAAREARRLAIAGLDEGYDTANERYKSGWSDKKIADECGIGEAAVAKLREDMYGPLGEPEEIVTMRRELSNFGTRIEGYQKELGTLRGRFEALCRKNGWPV